MFFGRKNSFSKTNETIEIKKQKCQIKIKLKRKMNEIKFFFFSFCFISCEYGRLKKKLSEILLLL